MKIKKKAPAAKRVNGHDLWSFDQIQDPWGKHLESFFEENDVGMDSVIHWRDNVADDLYLYNLMGWFDMEGFRPRIRRTTAARNRLETGCYGKYVPSLSTSMYLGRGAFRYEELGQDLPIDADVKFTFTTLTNLGVRGRLHF